MKVGKSKLFLGGAAILVLSFIVASTALTTPIMSYDAPKIEKTWTCADGFDASRCFSDACQETLVSVWGIKPDHVLTFDAPREGEYECTITSNVHYFDYREGTNPQDNEVIDISLNGEMVGKTTDKWCPPDYMDEGGEDTTQEDNCVYAVDPADTNGAFANGIAPTSFSGTDICFVITDLDKIRDAVPKTSECNDPTNKECWDPKYKQTLFGITGNGNDYYVALMHRFMRPGAKAGNKVDVLIIEAGFCWACGADAWCHLENTDGVGYNRGLYAYEDCAYKVHMNDFSIQVTNKKGDVNNLLDSYSRYLVYPSGFDLNLYCVGGVGTGCKWETTSKIANPPSNAVKWINCADYNQYSSCTTGDGTGGGDDDTSPTTDPCNIGTKDCSDYDCGTGELECIPSAGGTTYSISRFSCSEYPQCLGSGGDDPIIIK